MNNRRVIVNAGLSVGLAAIGLSGWSILDNTTASTAATATVVTAQQGNVLSSVSGTGNVIAPTQASVGFPSAVSSDTVTAVLVKLGDKVTAGQPLAKVDDTTQAQALAAAQAQLAAAQAALTKAQDAVTPAIVAQDQAAATQSSVALQGAQAAVSNAQTTLANDQTLQDAAVAQSQDSFNAAQAKATQDLANEQTAVDQARAQLDADNAKLAAAQAALAAVPATAATIAPVPPTTAASTSAAQAAVDTAQAAVAKDAASLLTLKGQQASLVLSTNQSLDQATNAITNAQNTENAKLAADQVAIDNATRQVASANAAYQSTLAGNAVKETVPTAADVAGQQASLLQAQDAVTTAQHNEDATTLTAPETGTISAMTAQVGQAASSSSGSSGTSSSGSTASASSSSGSSSGLFTLTDLTALQVKVGFSESDATNVKVGQAATITFDSLTGVSLTGKVAQLDLTATTVSNVVTYYAYVAIDPSPMLAPVKPGMTASVKVVVNHADGVVYLPAAAVTARGTNAMVNVEVGTDPNKTTPTPITIGLRGDSSIVVTSGLKAGDKVVVVRTTSTAGTGTSTAGASGGAAARTGGGAATGAAALGGGATAPRVGG